MPAMSPPAQVPLQQFPQQPAQQPVATIPPPQFFPPQPQPQSFPPPLQPPAPGGWSDQEIPPPPQQQPVAQMPPVPGGPDVSPTGTLLPPRRSPGQAPGGAPSLMNQQGLGGFGPAVGGLSSPSQAPQWSLPAAPETPPMPKREAEDPMTTILLGTGAPQQTSELENDPRNLAAAAAPWSSPAPDSAHEPEAPSASVSKPAPVSMPRQSMNIKLGGRKKSGGKVLAMLAALLLIGALGAAGWYFQGSIMGLVQRYLPSNSAVDVAEPEADPKSQEPATPAETATFDPLAKPARDLPVETAKPIIVQNTTPEQGAPVPPVNDITSSILGSAPQHPSASKTEIKPALPNEPLVSTPDEPVAPKATIVMDDDTDLSAPPKIMHVPGTAVGRKGSATDSLIEVIPNNPPVPAPDSSAKSDTPQAGAPGDVVVQATPESRRAAEALQAFFAAKNLEERMPLTLGAESMKSLMARYYAKKDSGPVEVSEIKLLRHEPKPETGGGPHCVFTVASRHWEYPIPVMLQEENGQYKVDWLAFVEFRDNLLLAFLSDYQDMPARFHVGIRRTHYFEDDVPDLSEKDCFEIQPPLPTYIGYVFVPKNTKLSADLASRLSWETLTAYYIVELRWRRLGEMKWVELTGVPQMNWYSFPMIPQPPEAPAVQKTPEKKSGGVDVKKSK